MSEKNYCYKYPHAAIVTDSIIFAFDGNDLSVLLIKRRSDTYDGYWAIPGGFLNMDETVEECASRELFEETSVKGVALSQFGVFSRVDRDPRERSVSVAFLALVRKSDIAPEGGDDASCAQWFPVDSLPLLAFDHQEIMDKARESLRDMIRRSPVALSVLGERFTISNMRRLYELVDSTSYAATDFERRALATGFLNASVECSYGGAGTEAGTGEMLYTFNSEAYAAANRSRRYPLDF